MTKQQVVTISFFRYDGLSQRWWAFRQMGLAPRVLEGIPGLEFSKMLGSGGGRGFSILPNLSVYGLLCIWKDESTARHFIDTHALMAEFRDRSRETWTVFMQPVAAHGEWDGAAPFRITQPYHEDRVVGVLTRATIYTRYLWRFWRFVPPVSRSIEGREGMLFSVGIGELPLIQQATFSLWRDSHAMKAYAYQSRRHQEVVKRTRELGWYSEELFARFHPFDSQGSWGGADPLARYLMY